jgi:FkbM family methyltransferase
VNKVVKSLLEKTLGCRIFRHSLPRGVDIFCDIDRHFGIRNVKTVFDIGANVGQSAALYAKSFPEADIYSFEPVLETFTALVRNTKSLSNVKAFNCAFGDRDEAMQINITEDSTGSSITHYRNAKTETISVCTLDAFSKDNGIQRIDFMKVDTEGFELEVIAGAQQMLQAQHIDILYLEAAPYRTERHFVSFAEIVEAMRKHDYDLFGIYEQQPHWSEKNSILYFNPVFISKALLWRRGSPHSSSNLAE